MARKDSEDRRVQNELLGMVADLTEHGLVSKPTLARVKALYATPPDYTPARVMRVRTRIAKTSQAAFASLLNVSVSTVQKWESPQAGKHPSGAAAKLLQLVEKKGVGALLPAEKPVSGRSRQPAFKRAAGR